MFWRETAENRFRRLKYEDYFGCLDRSGNGRLEERDFVAVGQRVAAALGVEPGPVETIWRRLWSAMRHKMDDDVDGGVSRSEFVGFFKTAAREVNERGVVPAWALDHVEATFRAMDTNHDGDVSVAEYAAALEAMGSTADAAAVFTQLDLDGDGSLSLHEVADLFRDWVAAGVDGAPGNLLLTGRVTAP